MFSLSLLFTLRLKTYSNRSLATFLTMWLFFVLKIQEQTMGQAIMDQQQPFIGPPVRSKTYSPHNSCNNKAKGLNLHNTRITFYIQT